MPHDACVRQTWRRGLGVGHEHFADCVAALAAAMRNPVHEELSISAAWALQGVARRLAEASPAVRMGGSLPQHDCGGAAHGCMRSMQACAMATAARAGRSALPAGTWTAVSGIAL